MRSGDPPVFEGVDAPGGVQWRRQDFVTGGSEVRVDRGSRVRSPPEAETFTAVHREFVGFDICRVIRRSSMTMKAHTYYICAPSQKIFRLKMV